MYTLSIREKRIHYHAFSRHEESINGTDWEWWILLGSNYPDEMCAYRFLVQAKKLQSGKDNYPLLSYGNKNGIQMDLLIENAKFKRAFPLYAYYSTTQSNYKEQEKSFPNMDSEIIEWCKCCINGCYISPANLAHHLIFGGPRVKISDTQLINQSFGLSLADYFFENNTFENALYEVNNYYKRQYQDQSKVNSYNGMDGIKYYKKDIPSYLKYVIGNQAENIDWIEDEYGGTLEGVGGIAVIDLRKQK